MNAMYSSILAAKKEGKKLLAVLIDPEKTPVADVPNLLLNLAKTPVTHILVGGSSDPMHQLPDMVKALKHASSLPILLFPGNHLQLSEDADALLLLSLISGRNPEYLIEQHIKAVPTLQHMSLEVIPTAYLLIEGGKETSVQRKSATEPMPQNNSKNILHTVLAGVYLGMQLVYLEAGSGAKYPVAPNIIHEVSSKIAVPLLVGGGIQSKEAIEQAFAAGADMVVIGTAFEKDPTFFKSISSQ